MGMYSKQEVDVNLRVLEDKVEFIMKAFNIANPLSPFSAPKSLLQVYYEVKSGIPLVNAVGSEEASPTDGDEPELVEVNVEADDVSVEEVRSGV